MSPTVLKPGGNVVTDKDEPETIDKTGLAAAADAVAPLTESRRVVAVHSGESFGHHHTAGHGISSESGSHDARGARTTHNVMKRLNDAILDTFEEHGVAVSPIHPPPADAREADGSLSLPSAATETILDKSFIPVLHGDITSYAGKGATVVSGDDLMVSLVSGLDTDRVGLCSTVPSMPDADGDVIPKITTFVDTAGALGGSDSTDMTGGITVKVRKLLVLGAPAHASGPEGLLAFAAGELSGTAIYGE